MNYEQACKRVDELEAILKQREAHDKLTECGCGDIRPAAEFCHICGKCQMGCCMCGEKEHGLLREVISGRERIMHQSVEIERLKAENAEMRDDILTHLREGPHCPFCQEWVSAPPTPYVPNPYPDPQPHMPDCIFRKLKGGE